MQIECPHCQTVFKLTDEQLQAADGMVRCGICHEVFNALIKHETQADLTRQSPEQTTAAEEPTQAGIQDLETIASAYSEAKKDKLTDETFRPPDEPASTEPAATEPTAIEPAVTEPATGEQVAGKQANGDTDSDDLFDGVQSKLIPDEYRIPELKKNYSVWRDASWSFAILLLAISLFAEYTWFNRNQLITHDELKPWIKQLCQHIDCNVLGLKDTREIEMIARNIYSHPNVSNALMVSVTLSNHAAFAQPYPDINIDFSDVRGKVVASRIFSPRDYMQIDSKKVKLLQPDTSTDFHLEIQDPGPEAMTYEFSFL